MKRIVLLATAALVAILILVPTAMAQETLPQSGGQTAEPLPQSGGVVAPSVLLPAAALLVGSGIVGYALVRRR